MVPMNASATIVFAIIVSDNKPFHRWFLLLSANGGSKKEIQNTAQTRTPLRAMGKAGLASLLANVSEQGLLPAAPVASPGKCLHERAAQPQLAVRRPNTNPILEKNHSANPAVSVAPNIHKR
jgi:hypothetical protein